MRKLLSDPGFAWVSGLTSRTSARTRVDDDRFTDEEILTVVRAGESGMKLADLCQATGITTNTYYEWKARYGGLTPRQLHEQRQRTRSRKRRLTMLACAVGVAAVGVGGLMMTRQSDAAPFVPPVIPHPNPVAAAAPAPAPAAIANHTAPSAVAAPATAGPGVVADPKGHAVQIAALPDLQLARVALEKLVAAGYPAHITTTTVNRVEMYRVRVGPLETREAADQTAVQLRRDGYAAPWVTR